MFNELYPNKMEITDDIDSIMVDWTARRASWQNHKSGVTRFYSDRRASTGELLDDGSFEFGLLKITQLLTDKQKVNRDAK